jgi:hypothetical protein
MGKGLRLATFLVAFALLGVVSAGARADTIEYYTVGHFGAGTTGLGVGAFTTLSGPAVYTLGAEASNSLVTFSPGNTLSFAQQKFKDVLFDPTDLFTTENFGVFHEQATAKLAIPGALAFSLDIYQITPAGSPATPGMLVGTAAGTLKFGTDQGSLVLTFASPLSFTLPVGGTVYPPALLYSFDGSQKINLDPLSPTGNSADIRGAVSAVPLPATASLGLYMLGGLGCVFGLSKTARRGTALVA